MNVLHLAHVNRQHLEGELVAECRIAVYHIGDGLDDPHARVKALDDEVTVNLDAVVVQVDCVGRRPFGNLNHGAERIQLFIGEETTRPLVLSDLQMQGRGLAHEQGGAVELCLESDVTAPGSRHGSQQHHDGHHDMSHCL